MEKKKKEEESRVRGVTAIAALKHRLHQTLSHRNASHQSLVYE